jgi:lysozyme family protein
MADPSWDSCLAFVLSAEGGYVDDPQDPGGATNMGITLSELSVWRHTAVTKADVQALTSTEAAAIYRANYWNATRCPDMPPGVDLMVFDAAVNNGTGRSAKFLQQAVDVAQDGSIGPATLTAVAAAPVAPLITALASERTAFYQSLSTFSRFGAGWLARVKGATALADHLAGITAPG